MHGLFNSALFLTDVRWPSSNLVILNTGSRWTDSVRDPNTVSRDLLTRMVKLLKGTLYVILQQGAWTPCMRSIVIRIIICGSV